MKKIGFQNIMMAANLLSMPVFFAFFWALRRIIYSPEVFNITASNFLWMSSPFVQDPYFIIPAITASMTYLSITQLMKKNQTTNSTHALIRQGRVFAPLLPVGSFFLFATFPAAFNTYILCLAASNLFTTYMFHSAWWARLSGLPLAYPNTALYFQLVREGVIQTQPTEPVAKKNPSIPATNQVTEPTENPAIPHDPINKEAIDPASIVSAEVLERGLESGHMNIRNTTIYRRPPKKQPLKDSKATK